MYKRLLALLTIFVMSSASVFAEGACDNCAILAEENNPITNLDCAVGVDDPQPGATVNYVAVFQPNQYRVKYYCGSSVVPVDSNNPEPEDTAVFDTLYTYKTSSDVCVTPARQHFRFWMCREVEFNDNDELVLVGTEQDVQEISDGAQVSWTNEHHVGCVAIWTECPDGYHAVDGKDSDCVLTEYHIGYHEVTENDWDNDAVHPTTYTIETYVPINISNPKDRETQEFKGWCLGSSTCDNPTKNFEIANNTSGYKQDSCNIGGELSDTCINLYAQWECKDGYVFNQETEQCEPKDYNITYIPCEHGGYAENVNTSVFGPGATNGGLTYNASYEIKTVGDANIVVDAGYTFAGWNTAANGSGTSYSAGASQSVWTTDSGLTLYAICTPDKHTISYECGGVPVDIDDEEQGTNGAIGSIPSTEVNTDAEYELAENSCVLTGYEFAGWDCPGLPGEPTLPADADEKTYFAESATDTYSYAGDVTCTAQWTPKKYPITYKACLDDDACAEGSGGSVVENALTYGESFTPISGNAAGIVVNDGYTFIGWKAGISGDADSCIATDSSGCEASMGPWTEDYSAYNSDGLVLYAVYDRRGFEITLDKNEAHGGETDSTVRKLFTKYGIGTYLDAEEEYEMRVEADNEDDLNPLTRNGGELPGGQTVRLTFNPNLPEGYSGDNTSVSGTMSFVGFYDTAEISGGTQYIDQNGYITSDGRRVALNASNNQVWYARYNCAEVAHNDITLTGYTFDGWYDAAENGNKVTDFCLREDTVVYAHWTARTSTITYDANFEGTTDVRGMPDPVTKEMKYDQNYTVASAPSAEGYTFEGWSADYNLTTGEQGATLYGAGAEIEHYKVSNDVIMKAQWAAKRYAVTYDKGAHAANGVVDNYVDDSNVVFDSAYVALTGGGANAGASQTGIYAEPGYVFRGWSENENTEYNDDFVSWAGWTVNGNKTVYAVYSPDDYQITFGCGTKPTDASTNITVGTAITPIDVTFKEAVASFADKKPTNSECRLPGYKFKEWSCGNGITSDGVDSYNVAGDTACDATWEPVDYAISYDCGSNATGEYDDDSVTFDTMYCLNKGNQCNWEGHTFIRWECDNIDVTSNKSTGTIGKNRCSASGQYTYPDDTECTAVWDVNTNDVIYKPGDYATSASGDYTVKDVEFGTEYRLLSNTDVNINARSKYKFDKWECNGDIGEKVAGSSFIMPDTDVTCTAKWTCNTHYHWDSDDEPRECVPDDFSITYVYIDSTNQPGSIDETYIESHTINVADEYKSYFYGVPKAFPTSVNIPGYKIKNNVIWYSVPNQNHINEKSGTNMSDVGNLVVYTFVQPFQCPNGYLPDEGANQNSQCYKKCKEQTHYTVDNNQKYYYPADAQKCDPDEYDINYQSDYAVWENNENPNKSKYNWDERNQRDQLTGMVESVEDNDQIHYFEGWYTNEQYDGEPVEFVPNNPSGGDITLYAKWGPCPKGQVYDEESRECAWTITYVLNGGALADGENNRKLFTEDEKDLEEPLYNPTRESYIFGGWYDNPDFNGAEVIYVPGGREESFTLYAKWVSGETVVFDCRNGTQIVADDHLNAGDRVATPPQLSSEESLVDACDIEDRTLYGWNCTDGTHYELNGLEIVDVVVPRGGMTCYADVDYNITYYAYDAEGQPVDIPENMSASWPKTFRPANSVSYPTSPSFEGYHFDGWYTAPVGGNRVTGTIRNTSINTSISTSNDVEVYAHLRQIPDCGEGQYLDTTSLVCSSCPTNYPFADPGTTSKGQCYRLCPARENYIASPERIYWSQRFSRINCTYTPEEWSITYMDGETVVDERTYKYEDEVTLRDYSKPDYNFHGWCDGAESCNTPLRGGTKQTGWSGDKTLYAQLTPRNYNIVYMDGNQRIDTFDAHYYTYNVTENVSLPETYAKTGYVFHGWKTANDEHITGWSAGGAPADANGTVTVYAVLEARTSNVRYYCDRTNGTSVAEDTTTFDEPYTYKTKTNGNDWCDRNYADGYVFDKWECEYGNNTFNVDGNSVNKWDILDDVDCYGVSKAAPYTITYKDGTNEIDGLEPIEYTIIENNVTLPVKADVEQKVTKVGYEFVGWKDAADEDVSGWAAGEKHGNLTFFAQWNCVNNYHWNVEHTLCVPDEWSITYKYQNNALNDLSPESYVYGIGATLPTDPGVIHDSYKFAGWCTGYNEETGEYSGCGAKSVAADDTGDKVFYATWEFVCESGKWWHVGNEKICLYNNRPQDVPVVRIHTANGISYMLLQEQEDLPIHKDSSKKFHIMKGDKVYNAYDKSLEDW